MQMFSQIVRQVYNIYRSVYQSDFLLNKIELNVTFTVYIQTNKAKTKPSKHNNYLLRFYDRYHIYQKI